MKTTVSLYPTLGLLIGLLLTGCGRDPVTSALKAIENGDLPKAEALLTQAAQQDPANANALVNLAIIQYKQGQWDAALTGFGKAADLAPSDPRPIEFIAAILAENNQWRDAGDLLSEAARRDPRSVSIPTALALVDLHTVGAPAARTRLLQILSQDPTYPPALFNLAVIDRDWLKNPGEARKYFQRYLAVARNDAHAPIARAALSEKPAPPVSRKAEAAPAEPTQKPVASAPAPRPTPSPAPAPAPKPAVSEPPPAHNPAGATAAFAQGVRNHQAGAVENAIREYTRALQMDPGMVRAHYNLGLLLRAKGDLPRAREAFTQAVTGSPNMADARYMLALVLLDLGNTREAISQLNTLIQKVPTHAESHLALGMQYRKDKTTLDLARKEFRTYLELAPNSAQARDIRKWLNYKQ